MGEATCLYLTISGGDVWVPINFTHPTIFIENTEKVIALGLAQWHDNDIKKRQHTYRIERYKMTTNTNKKHPIAKLINVVVILIVVAGMTYATVDFFASGWCQAAFGLSVDENSSWEVKSCAKYYWNLDVENPTGW
ncbi:hypothetical protein [Vibrio hepatarius]|uniref:hypothetical protein n=1 Tax=Vibrio hepatarius TaxID=171383 RepID=UPI001C0986CB|nr:hypothetical protein [Vibrio hepatarius]MBU2896104.1 hypothetical protein [Vibrio hepatarius]